MGTVSHEQEPAAPAPRGGASPMGRYGPLVSITHFDTAPRELEWQLPLEGELYRLIPGPDRPDYSLLVLERPLHFYPATGFDLGRVEADQQVEDRKGRPMVRVHALLVCARFVGQQLHPGMHDLAVNIAYVIDNSLARDAVVDFAKIEVAAVGFISEGHVSGPSTPGEADAPAEAASTDDDVVADAARVLRDGVAAHRGRPVDRLSATLVVGADHRLAGLSGNADGEAPVPTPETFEQVNEVLARLDGLAGGPAGAAEDSSVQDGARRFTVRVEGDSVVLEKNRDASA
ncbi:hypothetical protein FHX52_3368 [Humibacillus xanthopallidus]|uniref:Uncharacterized protein n=1 Tax=Humibacillus xanthopallidus TaxID=412689 RepID=A0A543PRE5_9MICO|nr:hypothetical protein FHX52_3368 [Humibacillus xanthopallidus]